jgi:hypothetical protein
MSVRRTRALAVGGFNESLGRVADSLISSEEADLFERLAREGLVWYEPAAIVVHQVLPVRMRASWLVRRGLAQGRTNARREGVLRGRNLRARCVANIAEAFRGPAPRRRALLSHEHDRGAVLNDLCRRAGHLAWAYEHLIQRARGWRKRQSAAGGGLPSRAH